MLKSKKNGLVLVVLDASDGAHQPGSIAGYTSAVAAEIVRAGNGRYAKRSDIPDSQQHKVVLAAPEKDHEEPTSTAPVNDEGDGGGQGGGEEDPLAEVRDEIAAAKPWTEMNGNTLKSIAKKLAPDVPVTTKADAIGVIEAALKAEDEQAG